ncbi:hypothetical protein GCM10017786_17060 [Amycolatopsis deserti]|uniref:Uncharacterized protein n=1 Tax=Amycolatopsis deserti TaxID=185696 RepID=A0ABQ3IIL8_9PSEU|nr:hypothetical protein GCM10017786_17060 [Amycolatopsis deserti]
MHLQLTPEGLDQRAEGLPVAAAGERQEFLVVGRVHGGSFGHAAVLTVVDTAGPGNWSRLGISCGGARRTRRAPRIAAWHPLRPSR